MLALARSTSLLLLFEEKLTGPYVGCTAVCMAFIDATHLWQKKKRGKKPLSMTTALTF
jgi:hypothetical protein